MANLAPGRDAGLGGLSPALVGHSEIRGNSSALDLLTLTGASSAAGNALVVRTNTAEGSTTDGTAKFVLNSSAEMKTSYVNVVALTSAAAQTIGSSLSGSVIVPDLSSAAQTLTLPAPVAGLNYIIDVGNAGLTGPTIVTSVGSSGSWSVVGDTAADGANLSTVLVNIPSLFVYAINSTKWVARAIPNGSSAGYSSAAANGLAVSS